MDIYEESLELHEKYRGKLEVTPKVPCESPRDLSLAYTPGVAQPCLEIQKNPENAYRYTGKGNTVAVITDGTAVLGLGNIGPAAGLCATATVLLAGGVAVWISRFEPTLRGD